MMVGTYSVFTANVQRWTSIHTEPNRCETLNTLEQILLKILCCTYYRLQLWGFPCYFLEFDGK